MAELYRVGDVVGQDYEIRAVLGRGGFGVVYLAYSRVTRELYALKTFLDEFLADAGAREMFRREAQVWIDLERHPYLVRAYFVDELGGRLHIATEYVAPDAAGLNTLQAYLERRPPDLPQALRWAVQFCHGIEYAYSRGLASHRDIKPANVLITRDRLVKISDFGLASVFGRGRGEAGRAMGTPTHMPPEQWTDAARCDARSDVYAFGVLLYQLAAGGRLPFLAAVPRDGSPAEGRRFWTEMRALHTSGAPRPLMSPLWPLIARCLEKEPARRYQSFRELRADLERLLERLAGERIAAPEPTQLEGWELSNKGHSLAELGRPEEALACFEQALALAPSVYQIWNNTANTLNTLGRHDEALAALERAQALAPRYPGAWTNKGLALSGLGRHDEALAAHDAALELDRRDATLWNNKGVCLESMGRVEEALRCFDAAVEADPRNERAWFNKANSLVGRRRYADALPILARTLEVDPMLAEAWEVQGVCLGALGRGEEGLASIERALSIKPDKGATWANKSNLLNDLGQAAEALAAAERSLALEAGHAPAWNNKGRALTGLGRFAESLAAFERAIELWPGFATAWSNKGASLARLRRGEEALACFERALAIEPTHELALDNRDIIKRLLAQERAAAGGGLTPAALCERAAGLLERDPRGALAAYEQALALDPEHALAWLGTALAFGRLDRYRESPPALERFLAVAPPRMASEIGMARTLLVELARDGVIVGGAVTALDDAKVCEAIEADSRAREALAAGRAADALTHCERALAANPDHAHAWGHRGYALDDLGRAEEALPCFDRSIALDATFGEPWLNKGAALSKLGRPAEAEACFDEALRRDPDRPEAWLNKAHCLRGRREFAEALTAYARVLEHSPSLLPAWTGRATCAIAAGRIDEAVAAIAKTAALDRLGSIVYARDWLEAAAALDVEARAGDVLRVMDAIVDVAGGMMVPAAWYVRGVAQAHLGDRAGAVESFKEFLAGSPDSIEQTEQARAWLARLDRPPTPAEQATALVEQGRQALRERRWEPALGRFDAALALDPDAAAALAGKAAALVNLGRLKGDEPWIARLDVREIAALRALLEAAPPAAPAAPAPAVRAAAAAAAPPGPGPADALLVQAAAHGGEGRLEDALRCFEAALRLEPKHAAAWLGKGGIEAKLGRRDEAMRSLRQVAALAPANAVALVHEARDLLRALERDGKPAGDAEIAQWRQRAVILRNQKQWEPALALAERVLAERPAEAEIWALKADCLRGLGREADALPALEKVTALEPSLLRAWLERGGCLLALTRAADGLACADRALELDPRAAAAMILKGKCLAALGRGEESLKWFDRVLAREPNRALARFEKARVEDALGRAAEAARGYQAFLNGATPLQAAEIQQARKRLAELKAGPPR
ncbi:MAG TPA: tetratricopeptide repeat protein [Candidatus Binatia bacterium]|nr:tetratricopeptide repeat protein [Candidatus Binatia bacterium]